MKKYKYLMEIYEANNIELKKVGSVKIEVEATRDYEANKKAWEKVDKTLWYLYRLIPQ